jgi:hypothetical protein
MSSPSSKIASDAIRRMMRRLERHDRALLVAEVRQLVNELRTSGPLSTDMLAQRCHTNRWHEGTLDVAIREGIRQRRLRRLPLGYVDVPRDKPAAQETK